MHQSLVKPVHIKRLVGNQLAEADDLIATEEPLEIRLGYGTDQERQQKRVSVTMRTPGNDFELALGFLFTEGIVESINDVAQIKYCTELNSMENKENIVRVELHSLLQPDINKLNRNFYTTSSCGVCGKESIEAVIEACRFKGNNSHFTIDTNILLSLPDTLRKQQKVFEYTGGIHASALFDASGNMLLMREDIGRHNALDKLIGACIGASLLAKIPCPQLPLSEYILLLSGRASFEQIQKAAMAGITFICSVGAPSSLAVETAASFGITLVGFLRENKFNIYTAPHRVITNQTVNL